MMTSSLRSSVTILVLLSVCQVVFTGFVRQTVSSRVSQHSQHVSREDQYIGNPYLLPDSFVIFQGEQETLNILSNDRLTGLDLGTFVISEYPQHGAIGLDGISSPVTLEYSTGSGFSGWDSFTYSMCDHSSVCYFAKVQIYVPSSASAPLAINDFATVTDAPHTISIDVLSNDLDTDGPFANYASLVILDQPENGFVQVNSLHQIYYTPIWTSDKRFVGIDTFHYRICDSIRPDLCSIGSVGVTVLDSCPACEACNNYESAFDGHLSSIRASFNSLGSVTHL